MANTRLPMRKIKEVLRLKPHCGLSHRQIAHSLSISRSAAADYLERTEQAGIGWPLPDFEYIYRELKAHNKFNLTMDLLWREYEEQHPNGHQYSQFCWLH